jgi:hypothetical protein
MATKKVWLGSVGPHLYNDAADAISDPDLPAGTDQHAMVTTGQVWVGAAPSVDQHAMRKMDMLNSVWPVGSVFIAVVPTNPNTLLGSGTWAAFATGRVLIGINVGDPDFDTVEETGGAKTVAATGTISQPTFTGNALAAHLHSADGTLAAANESAHTHGDGSYATDAVSAGTPAGTNSAPTFTGDAVVAASTNATPDLVTSDVLGTGVSPVTTATGVVSAPTFTGAVLGTHLHDVVGSSGAGSAHGHDVTGNTSSDSAGTPSGTVSQPTFTGSASSVVQPYIVVYMWKRTA